MRILFCNFEYPPLGGGGGVVTAMLAEELAKGHEVTVLTSQGNGFLADNIVNGVRVVRVPVLFRKQWTEASLLSMFMYIPAAIKTGKKLLEKERYDVINTHFVLPTGPVGDTLACFAGIPNILTLHGGDLYEPTKFTSPHRHPFLRAWIRHLLRRSDLVVGQSSDTIDNIRRFYTPEIEAVRIPLGIRRPDVGSACRMHYGFEKDDVLLITVGRLVARKAIDQLVSMMESFRRQRVRLLVLGTGPLEHQLQEQSAKSQLEDRVFFMGRVEEAEKFRLLQMCDIYVSTSQHEGFCLAFLEAMASGLPIVCYDYGGHKDFLQDGETGYLVQLNDRDLFRERCLVLMRNPKLRSMISEVNKRRVKQFFIEGCAGMYKDVFYNIVEIKNETRARISSVTSDVPQVTPTARR